MFREGELGAYTDDFADMGLVAFEYYLPAVWNYITSEASRDDHTVAGLVNVVFQCRHSEGTLGRATPLVLQCMDYLIANFDKFDIAEPPDLDIKVLAATLQQDEGVRQLLETEWANSGGTAEAFTDLLKILENPPDDLNLEPYPPGQTQLDRWKTLREAIAQS